MVLCSKCPLPGSAGGDKGRVLRRAVRHYERAPEQAAGTGEGWPGRHRKEEPWQAYRRGTLAGTQKEGPVRPEMSPCVPYRGASLYPPARWTPIRAPWLSHGQGVLEGAMAEVCPKGTGTAGGAGCQNAQAARRNTPPCPSLAMLLGYVAPCCTRPRAV